MVTYFACLTQIVSKLVTSMRKLGPLLKDREWVIFAILAVGVVLWATQQREGDQFTAAHAIVLVLFACAVAAGVLLLVQKVVRSLREKIK